MAIAVPIFTSELNKAKVVRDKANMRSVKAAGIAIILDPDSNQDLTAANGWVVTGTVTADGDITDVSVELGKGTGDTAESTPGKIDYSEGSTDNVVVHVKHTELSAMT